jgi:cytochrome c-type biogenesis protein CcmE
MMLVGLILVGVSTAVAFALTAFKSNLEYFHTPTEVVEGKVPKDKQFRLGGMVPPGSFKRTPGSMEATFVLSDYANNVTVSYAGVLPDLFREGQGVIARGRIDENGKFIAAEVLAKHDENYMPPDVADALRKQGDKRVTTELPTS